jgi:hypothetical protein
MVEKNNSSFDWLIYLSGQDYPVSPIIKTEAFLKKTACDGFIEYWDELSDKNIWGHGKFWKRYHCQYHRFPAYTMSLLKTIKPWVEHRKSIPLAKIRGERPTFVKILRGKSANLMLSSSIFIYLQKWDAPDPRAIAPILYKSYLTKGGRFRLSESRYMSSA